MASFSERLEDLFARARQERAANGRVTAATKKAVRELQREAQAAGATDIAAECHELLDAVSRFPIYEGRLYPSRERAAYRRH